MRFSLVILSLFLYLLGDKCNGSPPSFSQRDSISPTDSIGVIAKGQTVTFNCRADSVNTYSYSYIATNLNGAVKTLSGDPRYQVHKDGRLVITNAQPAKDDGYYFCLAKNSHGSTLSNRAKLRIAYLSIPGNSGTITTKVMQNTGFKYTFSLANTFPGHPKTTYTFTQNGVQVTENDRRSISDTGNLYIANIQIDDIMGPYKSVVRNTITATQYSRPVLDIQLQSSLSQPSSIKSSILLGPSDKVSIHNKGQSVTFECFATGLPLPSITWKKDGQVITTDSKYQIKDYDKRLNVQNIMSSDAGTYSCHVSNPKSDGAGTRTASLIVNVAPEWSRKPTNTTAKIANSVIFSCLATGSPTPKYTWYHNGVAVIQGSSARKTINTNNNDLTISSLIDTDRGVVQCVAANDAGYILGTAQLVVEGIPVWIDNPPTDRIVTVGQNIQLPCQASGSVTPTINWKKDGSFVSFYSSGSRFRLEASGSLRITNVQKADAGTYTCIATTYGGYRNASAELKVLSLTNITKPLPATMTAIKGYPKTLNVGITHDNTIKVTFLWTRDDSPITDQHIKVLSNGSLFITRVQDSDGGLYKCVVDSIHGNGSTSGRLLVQETPLSPSRPLVVSIQSTSVRLTWDPPGYDGNSAIISYNVESFKESESWKLALQNINPSSKVTAVVDGLSPNSRYKFRVRAVNGVGVGLASDATAFITTYAAPPSQAPSDVVGTPASAESILVKWKIPPVNTHNGALVGFRIAYRQSGIQGSSFSIKQIKNGLATEGTVTGLLRWTEYEIKVGAYNSAGAGPSSAVVLLMTGEGAPGAPVQNLKIVSINPSSVELQWEPPPQKQWNGNLKYYQMRAWEPSKPNIVTEQTSSHDSSKSIQKGTIKQLKKYTQYQIIVVAVNGAGGGPPSEKLLVKTQQGVPDAVTSMSISEVFSDGFRVSWNPPSQINGQLVAYVIEWWQSDAKLSTLNTHRTSQNTLAYVTTGLKPTTLYSVTVAAETQAGKGSSTLLSVKTVDSPVKPSAPSKPQIVEARAWQVLLRWSPGFSGRAPIKQYKIQYNDDSFYDPVTAIWKVGLIVDDAHRVYQLFPLVVPSLRPNTGYRFRVIATNIVGSSPPSNVSDKVMTLETAPSLPPSDLTVHPKGNAGEIELQWKVPPKSSWNSAAIGYKITCTPSSSSQHTMSLKIPNAFTTKYPIGGLLMYTNYKISIKSYSLNGNGESNTSAEVFYTTSEGAPVTPPTNVKTKVLGATSIQLTWSEVATVGRSGKIIGYQIYHRMAGKSLETMTTIVGGATFSHVLSNLKSSVVYEFEILAYTMKGLGPKSSSVRAKTLESVPGPPSQVRFSYVEQDSVKLHWNAPIYPHGNITGYRVAYQRNESVGSYIYTDSNLPSSRRAEVFLGLLANTFYRFLVWAKTIKGWGAVAEQVVYTTNRKAFRPDTPFIFPIATDSISQRSVTIEWRINEHPLSTYRYFTLQFNANNRGWIYYSKNLDARLRKLTIHGLLPWTRYRFRIMATNDAGNSPFSRPSQEVMTNPPVPIGAPRNVQIQAESPMSLVVKWTAPNNEELSGSLRSFTIRCRRKGASSFREFINLSAGIRKYSIPRLEVFTSYYVTIAAVTEKGTGRFTPELPGQTGELEPGKGPTEVRYGNITKTEIGVSWAAPSMSSVNGLLQGFKVFYSGKQATRRRRSVSDDCGISQAPSFVDVAWYDTQVVLRNLRKYVTYSIWIRAYNSKGDSPSSEVIQVTTKRDAPGPIRNFEAVSVFNDRVHLSWKKPCDPNGVMVEYEISYFKEPKSKRTKKTIKPHKTSYIVTDLDMLTEYTFEIKLKNDVAYGPSSSFITRTKGPAVLPGTPGKPIVRATSDSAILSWRNGHSGNVPFIKFEIQSRFPGQSDYETHWTIKPQDLQTNKTYVTCTVGNLRPQTSYQFRIIAWNRIGKSPPSPPSEVTFTGDGVVAPPLPLHQETWFISVTAVLAVILLIVIISIAVICIRRRKENKAERLSTTGSVNRNTLELKDTRQTGSLPGLHIAYRDPNDELPEVSSLGSKDGMSEIDGASGGEHYPDKDMNKISFVEHYAHDPNHQSWRTTYDTQEETAKTKYDEYMQDTVALPDDFQKSRFKSFSSLEGKDFSVPPPPAYESHPEDNEHCYDELPGESVTSFMSPEYEAAKTRSLGRPKSAMMRHLPYDSDDEVDQRPRRGYGSQDELEHYSPRRSREDHMHRGSREFYDPTSHRQPRIDGYSYSTMPHPRKYPKPSQLYQNVSHSPSGHDGDVSSEVSSSSDQRTPGRYPRGPKPRHPPKPLYLPKESSRRRHRPPNLTLPPNTYRDHSTSSESLTSPISPAPSYHSTEEYDSRYRTLPARIPPPLEYADDGFPEPVYQNSLPRREPVFSARRGRSREQLDTTNEVQISPYQSFV